MQARPSVAALIAVAAFFAGAASALLVLPDAARQWSTPVPREAGRADVGGPFELVDHTGTPRTEHDFSGRIRIIVFGHTASPDLTPAALQRAVEIMHRAGGQEDDFALLFITLDARRDTPDQLREYVARFHPRLIGLTGTARNIESVARAYRVFFRSIPDAELDDRPRVDHGGGIYLFDKSNEFIELVDPGESVAEVARRLARLLQRQN